MRFDSYLLLATLYDAKEEYQNEIDALGKASEINPNSIPCIDMLAKVSYKVGDLEAAERNYAVILRDNPLSYDAMYGMAKVEVKRSNYEKAASYVDRAVSLFTAEPQVYINRADVLMMMEQYDSQYPVYNWKKNKGYPTVEHKQAIAQYGPSPLHRMTFNMAIQLKLSL